MDPSSSSSGSLRPTELRSEPVDAEPDAATSTVTIDHDAATAHLARFEFSDKGTKILMVEWRPGYVSATSAAASAAQGASSASDPAADSTTASAWEVSWPGKSTVLPAREIDHENEKRRVFFLLPPDAAVPGTVTISRSGTDGPSFQVKPLPAIFPEALLVADTGTRGVLHTIWARRRLAELDREMDAEMRVNAESVGLQMALAEKQWIEDNFLRQLPAPAAAGDAGATAAAAAVTPPKSPVGGRLADKLKGLRLATAPADLVPSPTANTFTGLDSHSTSLSPVDIDVAIPSFSALPRGNQGGTISLDAALKGEATSGRNEAPSSQDGEDGLFALPISPRSPDMKKSPFSTL